jgi:hypothetical protein
MAIPSKQIGWGTESNLLWQIAKQIQYLTKVTASVASPPSGFQIPLPKDTDSGTGYTVAYTSAVPTSTQQLNNMLVLTPFIPANDIEVTSLSIIVSATGGLVPGSLSKILVYGNNITTPSGKLIESTDLDCSTSGNKIYNVSYTFKAGVTYWIGTISNSTQRLISILPANLMVIASSGSSGSSYTGRLTTYYSYTSELPNSLGSFPMSIVAASLVILK